MSSGLLGAVALAYLGVAVGYARAGNHGMALAWAAYAVANVGFIWAEQR